MHVLLPTSVSIPVGNCGGVLSAPLLPWSCHSPSTTPFLLYLDLLFLDNGNTTYPRPL